MSKFVRCTKPSDAWLPPEDHDEIARLKEEVKFWQRRYQQDVEEQTRRANQA